MTLPSRSCTDLDPHFLAGSEVGGASTRTRHTPERAPRPLGHRYGGFDDWLFHVKHTHKSHVGHCALLLNRQLTTVLPRRRTVRSQLTANPLDPIHNRDGRDPGPAGIRLRPESTRHIGDHPCAKTHSHRTSTTPERCSTRTLPNPMELPRWLRPRSRRLTTDSHFGAL